MFNKRPLKAYAFLPLSGLMLLGCPGDDTSVGDADSTSTGDDTTTSSGSPTSVTMTTVGPTSATMTTDSTSSGTMTTMTTVVDTSDSSSSEDGSSSSDSSSGSDSSSSGSDSSSSSSDGGSSSSSSSSVGSSSSSSSTTGVPSDFYGDCFANDEADVCNLAEGEACIGLEFDGVNFLGGAVCMELNCVNDVDCAPAPGGNAVPTCQDIGLGVGSCFLECTADPLGCPTGMHCTFGIGGIEATGVCLFPEAEDDWTCFPGHYNDGLCDCGCGVVDPDCPTGIGTAECTVCDTFGSCSTACPGEIDPLDNSQCTGGGSDEILEASPSLPIPPPGQSYTGGFGVGAGMTCATVTSLMSGNDTVTDVTIEIMMSHTWVGDLNIKIQSPEGVVNGFDPITVLHHPGTTDPEDDGSTLTFGNDADIDPLDTLIFQTLGVTDAEAMGAAGGFICNRGGGGDGLCDYLPNPGEATPGDLTLFNGEDATGDWEVCIGDSYIAFDGGVFEFLRLTIAQN